MNITYDPAKRQATLTERGLDFEDAVILFEGPLFTQRDIRHDYGEPRFQTIGQLANRMVMVVWTPRGEARHIFSMRHCNDRERQTYQERLGEG